MADIDTDPLHPAFGRVQRHHGGMTVMSIGRWPETGSHSYIILTDRSFRSGYLSQWSNAYTWEKIEPKVKDE